MRRSVFLFCFILFYFFIHTFLVKFMKSLYPVIKHEMKQKERKKERKRKKKKKKEKNSCTKKKKKKKKKKCLWACHGSPGSKYVLILGYRRLSHLLKIHFLNIFDVMSSLIHIHIITFHDLYHADCIVLFLITSTIIQKHVYKIVWNSSVLYTFLSK